MAKRVSLLLFSAILVISTVPVVVQEAFYKGRVIRPIAAYSAGGGYNTYARLIARYLGRHIPRNPTDLVENMTGREG